MTTLHYVNLNLFVEKNLTAIMSINIVRIVNFITRALKVERSTIPLVNMEIDIQLIIRNVCPLNK